MNPQTKRKYLQELVAEKNRWTRPLANEEKTLGFLGWHERGYLPHCDFPDLIQFITFRLVDSMPDSRRGEWEHLLAIEDVRDKRTKLEEYLDRGAGECYLAKPQVAQIAEKSLLHFHNERYELLAWCVMPNHVHVLVHVWKTPVGKMLQSWKRFIATSAEAILTERRSLTGCDGITTRNGPARRAALRLQWQREYWDTFMRDEEQERKAIRYIETNPVKAKLCRLPEEWQFGSARFRDEFRRLTISHCEKTN